MKIVSIILVFLLSSFLMGEEGKINPADIDRVLSSESSSSQRIKVAIENKDTEIALTGKEIGIIETSKGTVYVRFYPKEAPRTVENFAKLAQLGFYDGLLFHRYVPNFVIQGGDPLGNGTGDAGYNIPLEVSELRKHEEGALGIARAQDPNSGSCQFYITLSPQPHLDGQYTVFGKVTKGMDVVKKLRQGDRILRIEIKEEGRIED